MMRTRFPGLRYAFFSPSERYLFITWGPESIVMSSRIRNFRSDALGSYSHRCARRALDPLYAAGCKDRIRFDGKEHFCAVEGHSIWHILLPKLLWGLLRFLFCMPPHHQQTQSLMLWNNEKGSESPNFQDWSAFCTFGHQWHLLHVPRTRDYPLVVYLDRIRREAARNTNKAFLSGRAPGLADTSEVLDMQVQI